MAEIFYELEKEIEENPVFKAILDSLPEMIFIFEENGRLTKVNDRVKLFLEENKEIVFSPDEDEKFECKMDFEFEEDDNPFSKDCFIRNIVSEVSNTKNEIFNRRGFLDVLLRKKKKRIRVLLNAIPFSYEEKEYVIITVRDIQNIKRYEEQHFKDMHKFSVIGESVSTIVHDLKNPLTGLSGYLELLKINQSEDKKELLIDKMSQSVDRLQNMLEEILNIASGVDDKLLDKRWLDLNEVFFDVINLLNLGSSIKIDMEPNLKLYGDKIKLHNAFWNILKNAEESLDCDSDEIIIKAKKDEGNIYIEIKDTGKGIPEEIKENIFDLGTTFGKINGTGFGLASVKKIISAHFGNVEFKSKTNKGTTFYITLPIK